VDSKDLFIDTAIEGFSNIDDYLARIECALANPTRMRHRTDQFDLSAPP